MSWPTDGEPRHMLASISGGLIDPSGRNRLGGNTEWYVLDRAHCHRIVWRSRGFDGHGRDTAATEAVRQCDKRNLLDELLA